MEKEFVPYEQALALKELGFDETCMTFYNYDKKIERSDDWAYGVTYKDKRERNECLAPTFSQAFRFFREKYEIYSIIFYHTDNKIVFENPHYFRIYEMKYKCKQIEHSKEYKTYEKAELECLKKIIEIAKQ